MDLSGLLYVDELENVVKPGVTVKDVCTQGLYAVAFELDADESSMETMDDVNRLLENFLS